MFHVLRFPGLPKALLCIVLKSHGCFCKLEGSFKGVCGSFQAGLGLELILVSTTWLFVLIGGVLLLGVLIMRALIWVHIRAPDLGNPPYRVP